MKGTITLFIALQLSLFACSQKNRNTMDVVKNVDISRYLGTWYEIARFDHTFERGLEGVTATYAKRSDGKIEVLNQGYKNSLEGELKTAKGKAYIPNPEESGKLKVSFFLWFYAEYNILELDDNYQWALIGSSSMDYLWILSRNPYISKETYSMILEKAKKRGYDTDKLIVVKQKSELE